MQRSRLKNIINKSKSNSVSAFDKFKSSLPKEVLIDDNYRLEAAWKAYGSPVDYRHALWEGMIQPLDENTYKLPSIGYNEETDEYEYLNKGKENETVAKDIRVWDNDVIPFVKELKQGGFIRVYDDEKDCWTYKKGGKSKPRKRDMGDLVRYANELKPNFVQRFHEPELRTILFIDKDGKEAVGSHYLGYDKNTGRVIPLILEINGELKYFPDFDEAMKSAVENKDYLDMTPEEAEIFTTSYKKWYPIFDVWERRQQPKAFKQGGQMTTIPSGSLHARKNGMELAEKGEITSKGIPVVDNDGNQLAEIERNEVIFNHSTTTKIEELYKKFSNTDKESEKNEIAIKAGKILTNELINNTQDNTGLILEIAEKNNLEYNK